MKMLFYIKQAWRMMLVNKLFSAIYICGTALAIATTTLFALIYYVKVAPIYPEFNRMKTYYLRYIENGEKGSPRKNVSSPSYPLVRDYLRKLKSASIVSAETSGWDDYVQLPGDDREIEVDLKLTDPEFFKLYEYDFMEGRPFTAEEFDGGVLTGVISDRLAMDIFGADTGVVGRTFSLNYQEYRVCGVFREGSQLLPDSYAQVILPLTTEEDYDEEWRPFVGGVSVTFVSDDGKALKEEVDEIARKFNSSNPDYEVGFLDFPHSHLVEVFNPDYRELVPIQSVVKKNLLILLVLLLIPALNLSGLISSRMDMRSSEIGIRRSFGGTRFQLLKQVLWENLVLTISGGVVGLVIVWLCIIFSSGQLLTLLDSNNFNEVVSINLTPEILYAPVIFIVVFLLCVVLNILSALVPAWFSLRKPVISNIE